ncbi:MAG: hypothetical protein ACTTHG_06975 [Treponemataceae bacterium]
MKKRPILIGLFIFFIISQIFASTKTEAWTIACCQFEIVESGLMTTVEKESLEVISKQIPMLMLDSLPLGINRTVHPEEILQRNLYEIRQKQQKQFESIAVITKNRDTLMFTHSGIEFSKKMNEVNNQKSEAEKKLAEYVKEEDELIKKFDDPNLQENTLELISLYKNDSSKLYVPGGKTLSLKEINDSKIRALITGKIYNLHGYIQVETKMTLYPSNQVIVSANEFGSLRETEYIAKTLMNVFLGSMINDDLIHADIFISPEEAGENCSVYIEDAIYHGAVVSASFSAGKHTIRVESPGYEVVFFTFDFASNENKIINIQMNRLQLTESVFVTESIENKFEKKSLKKIEKKAKGEFDNKDEKKNDEQMSSSIYLNTDFLGSTPVVASIKTNNSLGEIENGKGDSGFFVLRNGITYSVKDENSQNNIQAVVKIPQIKENLTDKINKSRKIMYWSYGGLILSVPVYYFFKGMYEQCLVNEGIIDSSVTYNWKVGRDISMYTVIGAGINFLTQLIIYLVNADKVIPKVIEAKIVEKEEDASLFTSDSNENTLKNNETDIELQIENTENESIDINL